jgi:hypothetical protein
VLRIRSEAIFGALGLVALATCGTARAATISLGACLNADCIAAGFSGTLEVSFVQDGDALDFRIENRSNGAVDQLDLYYHRGLPPATTIAGFQSSTIADNFTTVFGVVAEPDLSLGAAGGPGAPPLVLNFTYEFETSNSNGGARRFDAGEVIRFSLVPEVAAGSISTANARAHVISIVGSGGSAWIGPLAVPELSPTLALFGLALLSLAHVIGKGRSH